MRINKSQSILLAVGVTAIFFGAMLFSNSGRQAVLSPPDTSATPAPENGEASTFTLQDFHRAETRNGKTLWEVKATSGQYYPETGSARLQDAELKLYRDDGSLAELRAGTAVVYFAGAALTRASTSDGVRITYDGGMTMTTDSADFDKENNLVKAAGSVQIASDSVNISGEGMTANVLTRELKLSRKVRTVIQRTNRK